METKTCTKCGRTLPVSEFCRDRKSPDGRRWRCKHCANEANKANLKRKREELKSLRLRCREIKPIEWSSSEELMRELRKRGYSGTLTSGDVLGRRSSVNISDV